MYSNIDFLSIAPAVKYLLLFVLAIIEGPMVMVFSGFLLKLNILSLLPAMLALGAGDLLGDMGWYALGYFGGKKAIKRFGRYFSVTEQLVEKIERLLALYQGRILFFSKITMGFGFALATLMSAGMARVSARKFLFYNFCGELIWLSSLLFVGHSLGSLYSSLGKGFDLVAASAGFIAVGLLLIGFGKYMRSSFQKEMELFKSVLPPVISIVIPTKNEEGFLRPTLENLNGDWLPPHEIIISDGRSTDRTVGIASEFTDKIAIHQGVEKQTIANARNLGARLAQGNILVFIDANVRIEQPEFFFSEIVNKFETDSSLAGLTCPVKIWPEAETGMDRFFTGLLNLTSYVKNNITKSGAAAGEFQVIRRSAFEAVGGYNEKLVAYEDFEIFERLAKIGRTEYVKDLVVYHSGRRAHKVGWLKLMPIWILNGLCFKLFKKSASKEWKEIR